VAAKTLCVTFRPVIGHRQRILLYAVFGLLAAWLLALGGYTLAKHSKMTAEKLNSFLRSANLDQLSGRARAKALQDMADHLNALAREERQRARIDREVRRWFEKMTEKEKEQFLEATLPTGFRQMLSAFEELPADRRKKALDDALKRIRDARQNANVEEVQGTSTTELGPLPGWSEELQKKATTIGLQSFYNQSTAKTKAEMAPILEELQQMMESGALLRGRRGG
jgi:hypothetical protein